MEGWTLIWRWKGGTWFTARAYKGGQSTGNKRLGSGTPRKVGRDKAGKGKQEGKARKVRKAGREGEKSKKQEKEVSGYKCIKLARYR